MDDLQPNLRDNTILLVDEAHRSQKGKGAGYAMTMRAKLPNAFRSGLTGTPIDRTMVNTHRDFGPVKGEKQERYLSYYGIRQAIRDGATVEVAFLFRKIPFEVDEKPLNVKFEQMADGRVHRHGTAGSCGCQRGTGAMDATDRAPGRRHRAMQMKVRPGRVFIRGQRTKWAIAPAWATSRLTGGW